MTVSIAPEIEPLSGRLLGFALAVLFASIGCVRMLHGGEARWWAVAISAVLALAAMARPAMLDPLAAGRTRNPALRRETQSQAARKNKRSRDSSGLTPYETSK